MIKRLYIYNNGRESENDETMISGRGNNLLHATCLDEIIKHV